VYVDGVVPDEGRVGQTTSKGAFVLDRGGERRVQPLAMHDAA